MYKWTIMVRLTYSDTRLIIQLVSALSTTYLCKAIPCALQQLQHYTLAATPPWLADAARFDRSTFSQRVPFFKVPVWSTRTFCIFNVSISIQFATPATNLIPDEQLHQDALHHLFRAVNSLHRYASDNW